MYYLSSPNYCSFCRHQRNEGTESSGRAPRRHHGGPETVHRESLPPDPHKVRSATDETDWASQDQHADQGGPQLHRSPQPAVLWSAVWTVERWHWERGFLALGACVVIYSSLCERNVNLMKPLSWYFNSTSACGVNCTGMWNSINFIMEN